MVTKYDVFEAVYKNKSLIKPIWVVRKLNKDEKEYHIIHKYLRELVQERLLIKKKEGFQAETNKKAELLYLLIYHCLRNGINYNLLLNRNLASFISRAFQKDEIDSRNININSRTLKNYLEILDRDGLILIISEKPLRAKIFHNALINNLLIYFGYKSPIMIEKFSNFFPEIKKELKIYRRLKRKNELQYQRIVSDFELSFTYHSLALEGNPITLPDTLKILQDKIIPSNLRSKDVDEIKNYREAILQMVKDSNEKKPLSLPLVLNYHVIAMKHEPDIAGKIRTIPVHIKGNPYFKVTRHSMIKEELDKLFEKNNEFIKKKKASIEEILKFAVYFHNEFQHIHPFEDGNSRTTRLITFHLLQSRDIPILDIPLGLLDEYLYYTKGSRKREDKKLYQNLQRIILYNLKKVNKRLS